ncbi:conserved hypothetical protein [Ignisphaera aggregans DSM 17230]|uniref:Uncharacterized protein n=1 Tax=Ignisphaera aggregans (strain DSM 17230 / JCM 13409 / AQ1.S1) TaxID=583356 RepID=E0STS2_IGNAA|nr:conserved hypothetical protein [Ignisphaera aggregans DSM 17230]
MSSRKWYYRIPPYVYLSIGIVLIAIAILMLIWSIGYMERAMVGTSLLCTFIGFTLLSSSLYVLRLSAYVYALEKGSKGEEI